MSAAPSQSFWQRHSWFLLPLFAAAQYVGNLYLSSSYASKADVKEVRQLVYDRTKPINERVGNLESTLSSIKTKLDERDKLLDERARQAKDDASDIKRELHDIQTFLRTPRK